MSIEKKEAAKALLMFLSDVIETSILALEAANINDVLCVSGVLRAARKPIDEFTQLLDEVEE